MLRRVLAESGLELDGVEYAIIPSNTTRRRGSFIYLRHLVTASEMVELAFYEGDRFF
jgi:hypothetical protein